MVLCLVFLKTKLLPAEAGAGGGRKSQSKVTAGQTEVKVTQGDVCARVCMMPWAQLLWLLGNPYGKRDPESILPSADWLLPGILLWTLFM